ERNLAAWTRSAALRPRSHRANEGNRAAYVRSARAAWTPRVLRPVPKSWIPRPGSSQLCRESKIVIAIEGRADKFRECRESGSERKESSREGEYGKKAGMM